MPEHFIITADFHGDSCILDRHPEYFEHIWQAAEGVRLGSLYPPQPLRLAMSRRMGGKAVFDIIANTLGYLIVSERVRGVLERNATADIEFLPIQLVDHKGRDETRGFFIANVLGQVDCVDLKASRYEESALSPGEFFALTKLVLDETRVDARRNIFRITRLPQVILVREELAAGLRESGATGLSLLQLGTEVSL
ncbi:imm11 family protein [Cystobacter fuscus]|uniref:imm11 family protein n=1 Tax=Cystobacter fuscus TaxID=43 RepID=UPI002B30008D|nr:hypothetical protein F0U63_05345 [Cystobacter fuscus]